MDSRKRKLSGWFYADIAKVLDPAADREEAIRFIPHDKMVKNFRAEVIEDLATPAREYAAGMFPLAQLFDCDDWQAGFKAHWGFDPVRMQQWFDFNKHFVRRFHQYQLPVIELAKGTPRQAVCQVFEKVNTGGVTLTVFELLTATFAADEFDLRSDWSERKRELAKPELRILEGFKETDFLQAATLLATRARREAEAEAGVAEERLSRLGCRRADMLVLTLDQYRRHAPEVVHGLRLAAKFLHQEYIYDPEFLPYGSQLVPLSAILAVLGTDAEPQAAREKLARWYWCGMLGELYGGTTETRFARDLPEVCSWVRGGEEEPRTVIEANFAASRLKTLRTRNSAAYKGLYTLILKQGARDWRTGEPSSVHTYFDNNVDIHHIFPRAWCEAERLPARDYDSIVNKTPLSSRTNRMIGGSAPSVYRNRLLSKSGIGPDKLDANLATHLVPTEQLWADDFEGMIQERTKVMLELVALTMGKPVSGVEESVVEEEDIDIPEVGHHSQDPVEEEPGRAFDRAYWEGRAGAGAFRVADEMMSFLQSLSPILTAQYKKRYIGMALDGVANNFVLIFPKKSFTWLALRLEESADIDGWLASSGVDEESGFDRGRYWIKLTPATFGSNRGAIEDLLARAYRRSAGTEEGPATESELESGPR
jgi:hypothetical protein